MAAHVSKDRGANEVQARMGEDGKRLKRCARRQMSEISFPVNGMDMTVCAAYAISHGLFAVSRTSTDRHAHTHTHTHTHTHKKHSWNIYFIYKSRSVCGIWR
jgi:hypothetical protein